MARWFPKLCKHEDRIIGTTYKNKKMYNVLQCLKCLRVVYRRVKSGSKS